MQHLLVILIIYHDLFKENNTLKSSTPKLHVFELRTLRSGLYKSYMNLCLRVKDKAVLHWGHMLLHDKSSLEILDIWHVAFASESLLKFYK
jgi:hypothetical protein